MALVLKRIKSGFYWYQQWYEVDPLTGKKKRKPTSRYVGPLGNPWGLKRGEMTRISLGVLGLGIKLANGTERYNPWTVPIHKAIGVPYAPHDAWAKERSRMQQGTWDTYAGRLAYAHSIYPSWELAEHVARKDLDSIRERADAEERKAQEWVDFKDEYFSLPESERDAWLAAQPDEEAMVPVRETPVSPAPSAPAPPADIAEESDDVPEPSSGQEQDAGPAPSDDAPAAEASPDSSEL